MSAVVTLLCPLLVSTARLSSLTSCPRRRFQTMPGGQLADGEAQDGRAARQRQALHEPVEQVAGLLVQRDGVGLVLARHLSASSCLAPASCDELIIYV